MERYNYRHPGCIILPNTSEQDTRITVYALLERIKKRDKKFPELIGHCLSVLTYDQKVNISTLSISVNQSSEKILETVKVGETLKEDMKTKYVKIILLKWTLTTNPMIYIDTSET